MATLPVFFSMGGRPVKTRGRASAVLRAIDWPALPMLSKIPRWLRPQLCYHEHPSVCGGGEEPNSLLVRLLPPPYQTLRSTYKVRVRAALPDRCGKTAASALSGSSPWSQPDLRAGMRRLCSVGLVATVFRVKRNLDSMAGYSSAWSSGS